MPAASGTTAGKGKCWRSTSSVNPYVGTAGARPALTLYLPDNSDKFVTYPGCNYYGDTRIRFNSNGTMTVWNTTSAGKSLKGPGSPAGLNCGNAAQFIPASGQKYPATGQTVPVTDDLVIYVQAAAGGSATCVPGQVVNGTTSGSTANDQIPTGTGSTFQGVTDISYYNPATTTFTTTKKWKRVSGSWVLDTTYVPNPNKTTEVPSGDTHPVTFDCGLGNVYVEGVVKGRVTIAAQNNVIVTGDLSINSTTKGNSAIGPDMVGLVAANSVVVYHPVSRASSSAEGTRDPRARALHPEHELPGHEHRQPLRQHRGERQHAAVHVDHDEDLQQHLHQHQLPRSDQFQRHPLDLRLHPDPRPQFLGAELQPGSRPGDPGRARIDRPEVAWCGGYLRRHGIRQGLLLRHPAAVRITAVLPAVDQRRLGCQGHRRTVRPLLMSTGSRTPEPGATRLLPWC